MRQLTAVITAVMLAILALGLHTAEVAGQTTGAPSTTEYEATASAVDRLPQSKVSCGCCTHFSTYHEFPVGQQNCEGGGGPPDGEWVECGSFDGGCHEGQRAGLCYEHEHCWSKTEEELDAFQSALDSDPASAVQIASTWISEGRLSYVDHRALVLVSGCNGGYAAAFQLTSAAMTGAVKTLLDTSAAIEG